MNSNVDNCCTYVCTYRQWAVGLLCTCWLSWCHPGAPAPAVNQMFRTIHQVQLLCINQIFTSTFKNKGYTVVGPIVHWWQVSTYSHDWLERCHAPARRRSAWRCMDLCLSGNALKQAAGASEQCKGICWVCYSFHYKILMLCLAIEPHVF